MKGRLVEVGGGWWRSWSTLHQPPPPSTTSTILPSGVDFPSPPSMLCCSFSTSCVRRPRQLPPTSWVRSSSGRGYHPGSAQKSTPRAEEHGDASGLHPGEAGLRRGDRNL